MKKKILIVDDELDMLYIFGEILSQAGYDVIKASNGQDAIDMAKDQHPDLIVLDIRMPGMDGIQTTDILKDCTATRDIHIIYLSNLVHEDQAEHGRVLGGKIGNLYFIPKTASKEEILEIVRKNIKE
jgi:CheY-like chemotaxis protein